MIARFNSSIIQRNRLSYQVDPLTYIYIHHENIIQLPVALQESPKFLSTLTIRILPHCPI